MWGSNYILFFMFYSFLGWFYESAIFSVAKHHKFINRGYLLGPCCPIYGFGAVINMILLKGIKNAAYIFIISMVTACILEYVTSYAMEKMFNARWWDYSEYPFNFQGRICLYGCLAFGAGNVIMIKAANPIIMHEIHVIFSKSINLAAMFLLIIILIDTVFSTIRLKKFNEKLRSMHDSMNELFHTSISFVVDKRGYIKDNLKITKSKDVTISVLNVKKHFKMGELRILREFPKFYSIRYSVLVEKIKEVITK